MIHIPFFCSPYFVNGSWPLSGFCSFQALEPKGGNSAKFHQCCIKKDSFNNSRDFSHSFIPETAWSSSLFLQAFYWFTLNHFHIPFILPNLNLFAYFFSTNSEVKGIVRCIWCGGKLNILGSKYWPIVCSLYICFLCSACISILLRFFFFFNWMCLYTGHRKIFY